MFTVWHEKKLHWYFKSEGYIICIRFIPFINKSDKDKRRFAWWRINEENKTN